MSKMAVRCVSSRYYNCVVVQFDRSLNKRISFQNSNIRRFYCCRTQCSNSTFRRRTHISTFAQTRYLSQDVDERLRSSAEMSTNAEKIIVRQDLNQGEEKERREQRITIDYYNGLPRITIPLPSRKENCMFILRPVSNTVGSFISMIKEEDHGIDRVKFTSKDGVKIAASYSIELLLEEGEFYVTINDVRYHVHVPANILKSFNKDDLEKVSDIKMLVSQLYESLNVREYQVQKERELRRKLEEIQLTLQPLEEQRNQIEKRAGLRTSVLTWVGLSMMGIQFGILARLTWWEYSWDIMEPVTYFVTYGTAMAMYAYFAITKQDYILPDVRDRQHLITLHKKAHKCGFDLHQYNTLKQQLANVRADLYRLQDPSQTLSNTLYDWDNRISSHSKLSSFDNVREFLTFLLKKKKL